jgi:hypothetical protein
VVLKYLDEREFIWPSAMRLIWGKNLFYFKTDSGQRKLLANKNTRGVPSIAKPNAYIKEL